jgi:hypothetical protein
MTLNPELRHVPSSSIESGSVHSDCGEDEKCDQLLFVSCYSDFERLGTSLCIFHGFLLLYCFSSQNATFLFY